MNAPTDITIDTAAQLPDVAPRGRAVSHLYTTASEMARKNPAEWVVLRGYKNHAIASRMRAGKYAAIDPQDYEIEMRRNEDGVRYDLYLKYVGKIVEK